MTYKLISYGSPETAQVLHLVRHTLIPADPGNAERQEYLAWLAAGGVPEPADPLPPPEPDWAGFLLSMKATSVFSTLRSQARISIEANALATELLANLQAAALGLVDETAIQQGVIEAWPGLTSQQRAEVRAGIATHHIPITV